MSNDGVFNVRFWHTADICGSIHPMCCASEVGRDDIIGLLDGDLSTEGRMATSSHSSHPTFSYTDNTAATWVDFILLGAGIWVGYFGIRLRQAWRHSDHRLFHQSGHVSARALARCSHRRSHSRRGSDSRYCHSLCSARIVRGFCSNRIAHRYWTYPAAQQAGQYNNWLKTSRSWAACSMPSSQGQGVITDAVLAKAESETA